jgi:hypothetical protein
MADRTLGWDSHSWMICRKLELEPNLAMIQHACRVYSRNFVEEFPGGNLYAVHVIAAHFDRLSKEVTAAVLSAVRNVDIVVELRLSVGEDHFFLDSAGAAYTF